MAGRVWAITAVDTGCGKTIVTGSLARYLLDKGFSVITQKLVQTGCYGLSEDILEHRRIMNLPLQQADHDGLTCPYVFAFPASPHLSAGLEHQQIDPERIFQSTRCLQEQYDVVLLEGVGGLMVPLTPSYTVRDHLVIGRYPLLLVSSARLGSINHTLLSLEACLDAGLEVAALVYNHHPQVASEIFSSTRAYLSQELHRSYPGAILIDFPEDRTASSTNIWQSLF